MQWKSSYTIGISEKILVGLVFGIFEAAHIGIGLVLVSSIPETDISSCNQQVCPGPRAFPWHNKIKSNITRLAVISALCSAPVVTGNVLTSTHVRVELLSAHCAISGNPRDWNTR